GGRAERLPLERQQAMALQIAERAIVREDVEAIARALEGASRLVAAVRAAADVCAEQLEAVLVAHVARNVEQLIVRQRRGRVERGGHDLQLAVAVEVDEPHVGARLGDGAGEVRRRGTLELAAS